MTLSKDIRERIIAAKKANEGSVRALAKRFSVGVASLQRLITRERKTGSIEPMPYGGGAKPRIPDSRLPELVALVKEKPDRTAEELRIEWQNRTGVSLSRSAMVRALKRCKLTFKKNFSSGRAGF
jgi:transposase